MYNDDLIFIEVKDGEDISLENSSGCITYGRSSCCSVYCSGCGCTGREPLYNKKSPSWDEFLEGNAGIIQY